MVAITGSTIVAGAITCAIIGGVATYAILKFMNGGEDFPSISNSSFGFAQWEHKSRSSLLGVNFDFNGDDAIFEVGIVVIACVVIVLICCGCTCGICGCGPTPKCVRDKRQKRRQKRRIKARRKRKEKEEEEMIEKERRRRKHERRYLEYKDKLRRCHWHVRALTEQQR